MDTTYIVPAMGNLEYQFNLGSHAMAIGPPLLK
jgi:hypothetical protein